ncbi:hypothetical protein LCGC14_2371520, partial [marine sediment metagenome]
TYILQSEFYSKDMQFTVDSRIKVVKWRCDPTMKKKAEESNHTIIELYHYYAKLRGMKMSLIGGDADWVKGIEIVDWMFRKKIMQICPKCTNTYSEHSSLEYGDNEKIKPLQRDHLCLHGDTVIHTVDGDKNISELVGLEGYVYSYSEKLGRITVKPFNNVVKTGEQEEVVKVILDDGSSIVCTPNHPFMLRNGEWVESSDLCNGDSLMPLYKSQDSHGHTNIALNNGKKMFAHRLVYQDLVDELMEDSWTWNVHHIDMNKNNNSPDNLQLITRAEHTSLHRNGATMSKETRDKKYGMTDTKRYTLKRCGEFNHRVITVEPYGYVDVYNMFVEDTHNFAANGVIVHNCTALKYISSAFPKEFSTSMVIEKPKTIVDIELAKMMGMQKQAIGGRYGN